MKSIEQRAIEVCLSKASIADMVAALSRAGLLVSERNALCRKLADAYLAWRKRYPTVFIMDQDGLASSHDALLAYDREHAPKPRYSFKRFEHVPKPASESHYVYCEAERSTPFVGTESECSAVCAALNALAEKEGGR